MATRKKPARKKFDGAAEVRSIARERVGRVKASRIIVPKADRKSKYKGDPLAETES